ncbi:hypothetical protein KC19_9G169900 [Ceratodon purpureus]|uniref:RING-type E3 ubiquitin transferase n=1 Tax=Ceratodon purpureus TaxID=3225 RepID=A0A8T0GW37_CERPU|nr:hypothetical protein KC19_9G169900 [Ceratodon purpureus]
MDQAPGCGGPGGACGSFQPPPSARTMVNSKVMVVAVVVLFAVVMFILCLHIYAKWFWRNQGVSIVASDGTVHTLSWRRRRYRGDPRVQNATATFVTQSVGLEKEVVEALPTFEFSREAMKEGLECAVCLEEFEEGEKGRTLPRCGHGFHLECIDMWLHSHSTCPLCRTSAGVDEDVKQVEAMVVEIRQQPRTGEGEAAVVGDVGAPFMAAMRASRRQQRRSRGQLPSVSSPTGVNSLPRTAEDQNEENHTQMEESTPTPAVDGEVAATVLQQSLKDYETPTRGSAVATSGSSIRAPFQVSIDIPRAGVGSNSSLSATNVLSPMARASASFRRLLSRGKSVVTPQSPEEEADESGPSSSSPRAPSPRPRRGLPVDTGYPPWR